MLRFFRSVVQEIMPQVCVMVSYPDTFGQRSMTATSARLQDSGRMRDAVASVSRSWFRVVDVNTCSWQIMDACTAFLSLAELRGSTVQYHVIILS